MSWLKVLAEHDRLRGGDEVMSGHEKELAMDHPNARTCWTKVRIDLSAMETVYIIETDLALLPDDPAYDHEGFSSFMEAIRAYLIDHPNYDRAEVIPIRGWENLAHTL
jgi:hypothetical protein